MLLAGEQGFEPQLVDPESTVLPIKLFPSSGYYVVEICGDYLLSKSTFPIIAQAEERSKFTG